MNQSERKAAISAYKERKAAFGIYAIRCTVSSEVWVGKTPTLDTIKNRFWFTLRMGTHHNVSLQKSWSAHGEQAFAFEVLEQLSDEEGPLSREVILEERLAHWQAMLNATLI
jgi:hypothetical protein